MCDQTRAPAALPQGKNPQYPLNMRLGDFQSWSESFEEREGFSPFQELYNFFFVVRPVAYPYTNWAFQIIINYSHYVDQI